MKYSKPTRTALALLVMVMLSGAVSASVIAIGSDAFPVGNTTVAPFLGLSSGDVNGQVIPAAGGVTFSYSLGNGFVHFDSGFGTTNNISPFYIASFGDDSGTLGMLFATPKIMFGYGYALSSTGSVAAATTISLFSGATPVGSLSYDGVPDPTLTGGFAGIQSSVPFDRVTVTFNSAAASAFALDNIHLVNVPVPEPSAILLTLAGSIFLCWRRNHAVPK